MTADPAEAEQAIAELSLAKDMMPDNPSVPTVVAYLVAANAYAESGQTNKRAAALARAGTEATALKRSPRHHDAVFSRVLYLDYVGDVEAVLEELRRGCEESVSPLLNHFYGLALYRRGDFRAALAAMEGAIRRATRSRASSAVSSWLNFPTVLSVLCRNSNESGKCTRPAWSRFRCKPSRACSDGTPRPSRPAGICAQSS